MIKKLRAYFSDSSSVITVIFLLGALFLSILSASDGIIDSDDIGNVLTFLLAFSAFLSLQASNASINKKLQIEQQPLVIISLPLDVEESPTPIPAALSVKNIGRGPALGVRVSSNRFQEKQLIFDSSQPASVDLAASEAKTDWSLDDKVFSEMLGVRSAFNLFISYSDQLGNIYEMRTDLQLENGFWRVVQNSRVF